MATTLDASSPEIRRAPRRVEGRAKVTGALRYAGDLGLPETHEQLQHAVAVVSTVASGRIAGIDAREALAAKGVSGVVTRENAPHLHKVLSLTGTEIGDLLPLQDDVIRYGGQCVAIVVADTLAHAEAAAALVRVHYAPADEGRRAFTLVQGADRATDAKSVGGGDKGQVKVGHAEKAFAKAAQQVDLIFTTSPHHHNAMEPGACVARWDEEGGLTVHVPTQFSYGDAMILGQAFGFGMKERLPRVIAQVLGGFELDHKVRVISTLAGGAFGGKSGNIHLLLAAVAAKVVGRPVRLVLTREQTFSLMPFRPESRQRLRLGADASGRLEAIIQDATIAQGVAGQYVEPSGETIPKVYACPNILVHTQSARLDTGAPGWMRGPGACLGQFAIETAMDVLAHRTGTDPLDVRLRNYAETEPDTGREWSSKSLRECYQVAAERIGWFERTPAIGSMRDGRDLIGYGMCTSIYPTLQMPAVAKIILHPDGRATAQSALHDIGQGAATAMTTIAAEGLGLPIADVTFEFGDSALPYGGMTVGSMTTLSNGAALAEAADKVKKELLKRVARDKASPLYGRSRDDLKVVDGWIVSPDGKRERVADHMARYPDVPIEEEAITGRTFGHSKFGRQAFGAQFVKVRIDPDTMHLQVDRLVGAFAGGRAINPLLVRSQLIGGMVWGIGQALVEESRIDERRGIWMNRNLGEALVPTNADVADVEAIIVEEDDARGSTLGVKGMGEIGVIGTPAAIGNAIFHATGIRLTSLPFRIDDLLAGMRSAPRLE